MVAVGCADKKVESLRILWPPLPAEPYMEWLGTYHSQLDFETTAAEKRMNFLLGAPVMKNFIKPTGIAGDSERGLVYIADGDAQNVRVYDFNKKTVEYLSPSAVGEFPAGLALDSQGSLYICDAMGGQIVVYSSQGLIKFVFGRGIVKKPAHLAINERLGRIYVSDSLSSQIVVFDMQGERLFSFGKKGAGEADLYVPQGVAISKDDRVYVADQLNARIQVFDADGEHLFKFGSRGDQYFNFEAPRALAFDSEDNLWVTDVRKASLMTFDREGQLLLLFAPGKDPRQALANGFPSAISIDSNDRMYIADLLHKRFQRWQFLSKKFKAEHPITEADLQLQLQLRKNLEDAAVEKQ